MAAISLTSTSPYTQDFNALVNSGTSSTVPAGWEFSETGTNTNTTYTAGTGSSNAGDTYSFGAAGATDRAFGGLQSGSLLPTIGASFTNNTGGTISALAIAYTGEQWRLGASGRTDRLDFQYSLDATSVSTGTWIDFNALDFNAPNSTGTVGLLDGNITANRTAINGTIDSLNIVSGATVYLRWTDFNATGADDGLAIDDFSLTANSTAPSLPTVNLGVSSNTGSEAGQTAITVTATATSPVSGNQTINLTIAGTGITTGDYILNNTTASNITITIPSGATSGAVTFKVVDDALVEGTETAKLTIDTPSAGIKLGAVTSQDIAIADNDAVVTFTKIHDIQGTGATAALTGTQSIEGIVTRVFAGATQLNGFYVQEEDADADNNTATSEAIFVFDPNGKFTGNVGDKVQVSGNVKELTSTGNGNNSSLTELDLSAGTVLDLGASTLPTVTTIQIPTTNVSDLERYEGMLVNISASSGDLTVTENYQLGRFGQVVLSAAGASNQPGTDARLDQYTQFNAPSVSGNTTYLADLAKRTIYLDDGSGSQNLDPILFGRGGSPLSAANTLRSGDTVNNITGILDERFEGYRIQTTAPVSFTATNPRPVTPPSVGGTLRIANFNLLNYFNDLDLSSSTRFTNDSGQSFEPRGANTAAEFTRQRDKTIQAIINSGADVLGLNEVENNGFGTNSAIQNLVDGLNAIVGAGTYAFINPGTNISTDAITVGIIYKTSQVTPIGNAATMPLGYSAAFDLVGRRPLAQTFQQTANGQQFTVAVNHLKSKGSSSGGAGDNDIGDGQGLSNGTRTREAQDLATWLATKPTGTNDPDYIIVGDLNAYAQEDPLTTLASAGYNNLLPTTSYSYVFNGQQGSIDHALGSLSLAAQVSGADKWHINADEPTVLDYNTEFKTAGQASSLYAPNQFRASDHDPVLVGLNLGLFAGTAGADNFTGTTGDDTYIINNVGDAIVENINAGIDTVKSTIGYSLGANLENLILTGSGNFNGVGNSLNNVITGNSDNNTLDGGAGDDRLYGLGGNDILRGGAGADLLDGGDGNDYASYNYAASPLTIDLSNPSNNTGEATGDTFISIENLQGAFAANSNLIGNASDNILIGYKANDTLTGGAGNDNLNGGSGNDTYVINANVDTGTDTIVETATGGTDTLDFRPSTIDVTIDLSLTTTQTIALGVGLIIPVVSLENVNGGAGNDNLTGNSFNNILFGGGGNDTLRGGAGNDSFYFGGGALSSSAAITTFLGTDTIADFTSNSDRILLSKATFAAINSGLSFTSVADDNAAKTSAAAIVYSTGTGNLFYNQNGIDADFGNNGGIFANLTGKPTIAATDFTLVA